MQITDEITAYTAKLAHIRLNGDEAARMQEELARVIEYMEILDRVDTAGIAPLAHVSDAVNVWREDIPGISYDRAELLKNAPQRAENTVIVPKTVE